MSQALELAKRGVGFTSPNPCVGAVLVRKGEIAAQGFHAEFGGPHAEAACLADARDKGVDPSECTLYVTLEPCNHFGKTPPCTVAILEAKVPKVVVGVADPNPHVSGGGIHVLRERGVQVVSGVLEQECRDLIADFMVWQTTKRPYVQLKLAQTLDGRIAGPSGAPEAVSGPESRCRVHGLRAVADAVLVGGGTLRADNPQLTCRLSEMQGGASLPQRTKDPLAVVVTTNLPSEEQSDDSLFLTTQRAESTVFFTTQEQAASEATQALQAKGCRVFALPTKNGVLDLAHGLKRLRLEAQVYRVLCEGGGTLAANLLEQCLVDELKIFLAPRVLGDERAPSSFAGRRVESMAQAEGFRYCGVERSGVDLELTLRPALSGEAS